MFGNPCPPFGLDRGNRVAEFTRAGDDPKLKDWAGKTLPTLRHHLEMAQNLGKTK
jgi:hypothetical protein